MTTTYNVGNLRFTLSPMGGSHEGTLVFNVTRISDGHWLPGQSFWQPEAVDNIHYIAADWMKEHPGLADEPAPTVCSRCHTPLTSDSDTNYQFENALWVGLHGGYAMFTDNFASWPTNTSERWIVDDDADLAPFGGGGGDVIENEDWEPEYEEPRILPGRPEHEFVLCHFCAHALTEFLGIERDEVSRWHSHRDDYRASHPNHFGWDYDRAEEPS
jgi:hypothetical protein